MNGEASPIYSNLRRATKSYDEELSLTPEQEALVAANPMLDVKNEDAMIAAALAYEENYKAAERRRWRGQERWMGKANEEMRLVNILHPHAIFRKLQRAGVDCSIEPPTYYVWQPDFSTGKIVEQKRERSAGRFWLYDFAVEGRIGIGAWKNKERIHVTSLQYPYGPEWSLIRFDQFDVPINERYRGWRTALLHLIVAGILTEEEVDRAFGPVKLNAASEFYRMQLQEHRKRTRGLVQ